MENQNTEELELVDEGLTPEEEAELQTLESKHRKVKMFKIGIGLLIVVLLAVGTFGTLRVYPFLSKFEGEWADEDSGNYLVENKGDKSTFKISNVQNSPNLTIIFKGDLYSAGSNRYRAKNNDVFLEVYKKDFPQEAVDAFKKESESYKIIEDTDEILLLQYSDKAVKAAFGEENIDHLFYYELTDFGYGVKGNAVKLRNTGFASTTIKLAKESH